MAMWALSAVCGSVGPFCAAHWTSSPDRLDFVWGREKTIVLRLFRSVSALIPVGVMCSAGLNESHRRTVNSPTLAAV